MRDQSLNRFVYRLVIDGLGDDLARHILNMLQDNTILPHLRTLRIMSTTYPLEHAENLLYSRSQRSHSLRAFEIWVKNGERWWRLVVRQKWRVPLPLTMYLFNGFE